jgi:hypothetical protein
MDIATARTTTWTPIRSDAMAVRHPVDATVGVRAARQAIALSRRSRLAEELVNAAVVDVERLSCRSRPEAVATGRSQYAGLKPLPEALGMDVFDHPTSRPRRPGHGTAVQHR